MAKKDNSAADVAAEVAKQKKKGKTMFDFMTVLGWIVGFSLILFGIVYNAPPKATDPEYETKMEQYQVDGMFKFSNFPGFIDPASLAITCGGTVAALMIAFPMSAFSKVPGHLKIALLPTEYDTQKYIDQIVDFARDARMKGLLSLEDKLQSVNDAFLKSSLMLVVDSVEPEKVHNLLEAELDHLDERHAQARAFYDKGAAFAPGFGMIGTLIGLVLMLANMSSDASAIGSAMATALLTTLYGSMLGNLFFGPISNKLRIRHEEEYLCKVLICEGVEAIQGGENPKFIEEKLNLLVVQPKKPKKVKGGKAAAKEE